MYFIEFVLKKIFDRKQKKNVVQDYYPPTEDVSDGEYTVDDFNRCNHNFMPIDSTGEVMACSNCGFVIKKSELGYYMKNPFANNGF